MTKRTFSEFSEDNVPTLAAALAYYAVFALAPLLILAIAIAGFVLGEQAASGEVYRQVSGLMGDSLARTVQDMVQNASRPGAGIFATIISVVLLLLGASGVFAQLQLSLNLIWEVKPKPMGVWGMIRQRFWAFLMVLGIGVLLLAATAASAVLSAVSSYLNFPFLAQTINILSTIAIATLLFALVYKMLPDVEVHWKDVWVGALATAVLFAIGKHLIGLYLARGAVGSAFGAAGSLVAILVWLYYSSMVFFFGAELTQVYANWAGRGMDASAQAVPRIEAAPEPAVRPEEIGQPTPQEQDRLAERLGRSRRQQRQPASSSNGQEEGKSRLVPVLIGLAVGRFLLPRKKKRVVRPKEPQLKRHFVASRVVEPGWVSRRRATEERMPRFLQRLHERLKA